MSTTLTPLAPEQLQKSHSLKALIANEIETTGPLSFARFMEQCLYHPELGYYLNGASPFGRNGDFITAPELGDWLARACLPSFKKLIQSGIKPVIVELGGGSGQLTAQLLSLLQEQQIPWEAYHVIEISPALQRRQQQRLSSLPNLNMERVHWHTQLDFPVEGLVIANEFLDAFPVHLIQADQDTFYELKVDTVDGEFLWIPALLSDPALIKETHTLKKWAVDWPSPYRTEVHIPAKRWLSRHLPFVQKGLALWIDYGYSESVYYHPDRITGTLRAHIQHLAHEDVLAGPGLQDLTAFVNFSSLSRDLAAQGWRTAFFASQAEFLLSQGILDAVDPDDRAQIQAIKTLTLDMGETFQVLGVTKGLDGIGFPEIRDRSGRL